MRTGVRMLRAHRAIESICLDREVAHLKDDLMPGYASLIYNGYWWSPERRMRVSLRVSISLMPTTPASRRYEDRSPVLRQFDAMFWRA